MKVTREAMSANTRLLMDSIDWRGKSMDPIWLYIYIASIIEEWSYKGVWITYTMLRMDQTVTENGYFGHTMYVF